MSKVQGFKGLVSKSDRNKVCAVDGVKGVSINFSPPKHETTSACYVWPSHHSSRNFRVNFHL